MNDGCEYELMVRELNQIVRYGMTDKDEAEMAARLYEKEQGVKVVVVENWRS